MPSKDTKLKYSGRSIFLSKELWRKYKKETGDKIEWKEFKQIILASNEEIKNWVLKDPSGFKFPGNIGTLSVNAFKPTKNRPINGQKIQYHNLHTHGNVYKIQLFYNVRKDRDRSGCWGFDAERKFKREFASILKSGKFPNYNSYAQDHFRIKG